MKSSIATSALEESIVERGPRKGLVLAVLSLSTFLIFLDGTIVNTALPAIARDFSASNSVLQWVVNAYSLILAGFLLVGGSMGDRFGRRKTLTIGMVIFGAGAMGAALAGNPATLIMMRGVQGLGAALALPATLSILTDVFPRGERAKAIATWTAVGSIGIAIGPALGGFLVDRIAWSAVFWLHIPVVVLFIAGLTAVPESRDSRRRPIDIPGALLATAGMLTVVYGAQQGGDAGWGSPGIVAAFVAGGALLAAFALVEARSSHPMLPLQYFKRMDFTGSFLVLMLLFVGMMGVFFFLTQYLQLVQGRSALVAGAVITPVAVTMMIGAGIAMKAGQIFGPKAMAVISTLIILSGMAVFSQIEVSTPFWLPVVGILLFGLGAGIAMPTVTDSIMASVSINDAGVGSAMNDLSRELGLTLGIAVLGSLVAGLYRTDVTAAIRGLVPENVVDKIGDSMGSVGVLTADLNPQIADAVTQAANQSFVNALQVGYLGAAGFIVMALLVAVTLIPKKTRKTQAEMWDLEERRLDAEDIIEATHPA